MTATIRSDSSGTFGALQVGGVDVLKFAPDSLKLGDVVVPPVASSAQAVAGTSDVVAIAPLKLREGLNAGGAAPVFACRAWVLFDGATGAPAIKGSGNVSSITDNGLGDWTINFSVPMPTIYFAYSPSVEGGNAGSVLIGLERSTTSPASASYLRVLAKQNTTPLDRTWVSLAIFC